MRISQPTSKSLHILKPLRLFYLKVISLGSDSLYTSNMYEGMNLFILSLGCVICALVCNVEVSLAEGVSQV